MKKMLELFAGTHVMADTFREHGWEAYTVDWDPAADVDLHADIGSMIPGDIITLCGGVPDVIWASPDCTSYSLAAIGHHRTKARDTLEPKTDYAMKCDLVNQNVLYLIDTLLARGCSFYFIENPRGGMRKMKWMQDRPRYTVTYCFAGETEVITREGVRTLGELAGHTASLLTPNGWMPAPVREYGVKELMRLTLSRAGKKKEIYVTKDHRWILKNGKIVETSALRKGQRLAYCKPSSEEIHIIDDFVARGFAYGDGYILSTKPEMKGFVMFCGEKSEMIPFFDSTCGKVYRHSPEEEDVLLRYGYPREWKTELPDATWSADEKASWIDRLIAADGSVSSTNAQIMISSSRIETLEVLRDRCREIGIDTYGIITCMRKGYCDTERPLYQVTLMRSDVPDCMILRRKHKDAAARVGACKHQARCWTVVSVEETDRVEMTYCAEVPEEHVFTLNDGILTHNCQYGDRRMKPTDIWTNHPNPDFKPMCHNGDPCHERAPRGSRTGTQGIKDKRDRARVPKALCEHIVEICENPKAKRLDIQMRLE